MTTEAIVLEFVDAINRADCQRLGALMTPDHVFIDSDGSQVRGQAIALRAWSQFFTLVTEYRVVIEERFSAGNTVVLVGRAEGRARSRVGLDPGTHWSVPAAWRAVVTGERVAEWQVFVNPEPIVAALAQRPTTNPTSEADA